MKNTPFSKRNVFALLLVMSIVLTALVGCNSTMQNQPATSDVAEINANALANANKKKPTPTTTTTPSLTPTPTPIVEPTNTIIVPAAPMVFELFIRTGTTNIPVTVTITEIRQTVRINNDGDEYFTYAFTANTTNTDSAYKVMMQIFISSTNLNARGDIYQSVLYANSVIGSSNLEFYDSYGYQEMTFTFDSYIHTNCTYNMRIACAIAYL